MTSVAAAGDLPPPEPPDPPDPPNPPSNFAQTSISNPSSISLPFPLFHHLLSSSQDLDLGLTISSSNVIFFVCLRCFPAVCSSWFQICSEICFSLVGVQAKSVGSVVSLSIWHVMSISLLARRRHGNFSLVAIAKRSSFPLMVVTRRLPLLESGSDVSAAMSSAPFPSLSNRSFCFAPTISWKWSSTKTPLVGFNPIASLSLILRYDFVSGFAVPLRFFTAACSPWKLAYFSTYVRCGMISLLVLSFIHNLVIVRLFTAICSLLEFNMAFVAVILASLSWWQLERKSVIEFGIILDWELILSDHLNGDSDLPCIEVFVRHVLISFFAKGFVPIISTCVYAFVDVKWEVQSLFRAEPPHLGTMCQFFFPKFPLDWSGLDDQTSPVLQGSSSRLIVSFAFIAEFVILRVAVDAVTHEALGIALFRSPLVSFVDLYLQSILSLSYVDIFSGTSCPVFLLFHVMWVVFPPLLSEIET